ncbi:MAG: cell surface protein, partial [Nocardia sp.]|nr:cell surface protein [Nocardia sp.]
EAPAPAPPAAAAPAPAAKPNHEFKPTSDNSGLPEPELLSVIGGLIALTLAATGSGAVSFQGAAAAQARVNAARAEFFGPRS